VSFVLDASVCLHWCFDDEATQDTQRLLELAMSGTRLFVPSHWPAEVLNALIRAERRGRVSEPVIESFLDDLAAFHISIDAHTMTEQWSTSLVLARTYQLSAYDAAYLALALRLKIPLATLDDRLRVAATIEGVALTI